MNMWTIIALLVAAYCIVMNAISLQAHSRKLRDSAKTIAELQNRLDRLRHL